MIRRILSIALAALTASVVLAAPLTVTVSCTGTGTRPPMLSVTPLALTFGAVDSGGVSILSFTIRNTGGGTLVGSVRPKPTCGPDFTIFAGGNPGAALNYSLTAGQSLVVPIRFAPLRVGAQDCAYDIGQ